jgi:hypothetical protein
MWLAGLRWVAVITFFLNASQRLPIPWKLEHSSTDDHSKNPIYENGLLLGRKHSVRDFISIILVGSISFFSGYLVTSCYQLAPFQLPVEVRPILAAKQATLLTVAFSVSALAGLITSFVLLAVGL